MRSLLLLSTLLLWNISFAQEKNRIFGKTIQRSSGTAIPNASVFISGTSLGTMTDSAGNFELNGIPAGAFELIVSSVGFTTIVHSFTSDKLPLRLSLQMDPKVVELNEVTVEPFDPNGWENWGKMFLDNFIGTSYAGRRCRILNKGAVRFRYNQKQKKLTVIADEPIIIENEYLGYTLKYQLEEFVADQNARSCFFYGYSLYEDKAQKSSRVQSRFIGRRKQIYNGSMAHFMKSLYHDRLQQEGFEARRVSNEPNHEKERVKLIMASLARRNITSGGKTVMKLGIEPPADSTAYYKKVMQQPNHLTLMGELLTADSLVTPNTDSTKDLSFPGYLRIVYTKGIEEGSYLKDRMQMRKAGPPVSMIFMNEETSVSIYPNGYYYPPHILFSLEYWGWSEKLSHMLPIDYEPPTN